MALLTLSGSRAWATDVFSSAVVGTSAFQAQALTIGASDYNISKNGDNDVIISAKNSDNLGAYTLDGTKNYLTCTLVVKINVPSTTSAGVLCHFCQTSGNTTSAQGLYMDAERKLTTSWGTGSRKNNAGETQLAAGEHTIIYTASTSGAKVYIDGTTTTLTDTGLKGGDTYYKVIRIPAAYAQYITEVHLFNSVQNTTNISSIVTECSNHFHASQQSGESVTVPSGKTLVIDADNNLSKYSFDGAVNIAVASGKTLTLDQDNSSITTLSGSGTALQSTDITTTVTGSVTDITLKATAGTLTYTGTNLNGSTLDGVILGGSARITTSNTVNIKNLAGNNISGNNGYAFVGSGTLNFYGTCDLTKNSDGSTDNVNCNIGYGSSANINIKEDAEVTTGAVFNTSTSNSNASITVETGATLIATGQIRSIQLTNNGTINSTSYIVVYADKTSTNNGSITATQFWGPITLAEGSTTTLSDASPFNSGAVTVSGDATLNLTATTSTLSQAITVADSKTLTIDGDNNTVDLTSLPTLGTGSAVNFIDATVTLNFNDRTLSGYTFTNCTATAQFTETGDEYKAGGFTITNIPSGVTVKVKKYDATDYETVTPEAGTATISHEVGVSGLAAWLDYTFNESTKATNLHSPADQVITNAGNAGSGNNLTIDTGYNTDNSYNEDGTLKVMSTPWRNITWPTNYTVAVAGNVPDVENGCLVAFGSTTAGSQNYLAIIRGASQNEIKLVKGHGMNSAFEVISTMTAANATALSHLVVFTKNGNTFTVYLDGIQKTQVTYSDALGGGFQIGSLHGGVTGTGVGRVNDIDATLKAKVFAKAIRVYDYVITSDQMTALTEEFPYVSYGGTYSRTISENSNLSATNAWLNKGSQGNVDVPVNAIVDAVTYYPDVEITTTTASTLTVNADMDAENIKFDGAGKLTIASDGTHNIHIYGSLTANGPVSVKYGETDLSAVPVAIGESGSVEFDFSASDFSSVNTQTDYTVTGNTADYGSKVTGVYPSDDYHTYTLAHNGSTNSYILTVEPSVKWWQDHAIALVTPYYNENHVGAGVGKYTISLGETPYANLVDFGTAVMSWTTMGDCVEPTIAINQPTSAFYRIKSGSKYLQDVRRDNENTQRTMTDTDGAETIFYLNGNTLVGYKTGFGFGYSVCQTQDTEHLNTQLFTESAEVGKYTIQSQQGTCTSADYNEGYWGIDDSDLSRKADAASGACWTLEEVTSLPVSITSALYATLYSPVALTIPDNVQAYYISSLTETEATLSPITTTIPANTPVILKADAGAYNFNIVNDIESISGNKLSGITAAQNFDNDEIYTLQQNKAGNAVGLFPKTAGTLAGFKAYLSASQLSSLSKGFVFNFDIADGIDAARMENTQTDNAIFNLAGQRVEKAQKGIYIVNGKKVLVK